jgi:hypothetical protein
MTAIDWTTEAMGVCADAADDGRRAADALVVATTEWLPGASGVVRNIAVETLRSILREKNVTFQRTRSWKHSTDPAFADKATRIMMLLPHRPG